MKIGKFNIPFTTRKNPKPKQVRVSPDSARIQRELDYEKRLGKASRRRSFGK